MHFRQQFYNGQGQNRSNLVAGLLVELKGINLEPQLVFLNSWQEMGGGFCQVSIDKTPVRLEKKQD